MVQHGRAQQWALCIAVALASAAEGGCTLIGAGVGAASKPGRDERVFPAARAHHIPSGSAVRVQLRSGESLQGTYPGPWQHADGTVTLRWLSVDTARGRMHVPAEEVTSITVPGEKSGALPGALIGLAVDLLMVYSAATWEGPSLRGDMLADDER